MIKASNGFYSEYLFTEDGILDFRIVSRLVVYSIATFAAFVGFGVGSRVSASLIVTIVPGVCLYGTVYGVFRWWATKKLSRLSLSPDINAAGARSVNRIPWTSVDSILISNGRVRFDTGNATFVATLAKRDEEQDMLELARSKAWLKVSTSAPRLDLTMVPVTLASAGALLILTGVVLVAVDSGRADAAWITILGMVALSNSSAIFGLQNPRLLSRALRISAYVGLVTLNFGFIGLLLTAQSSVGTPIFSLSVLTTLVGAVLTPGIGLRALRNRWEERRRFSPGGA